MTAPAWDTIETAIAAWVATGSGATVVWEAQQGPRPPGAYVSMRLGGVEAVGRDWLTTEAVPLVVSDLAFTAAATDIVTTATPHGLATGDGPFRLTSTGSLPAGLALTTDYWLIVTGASTLKLASSFADARAVVPVPVDITGTGTGTHTLSDTADTESAGAEVRNVVRGPRQAVLTLQAFGGLTGKGIGAASPVAMLTGVLAAHRLPTVNAALSAAGVGVAARDPVRSLDAVLAGSANEARATTMIRLHLIAEVEELGTYVASVEVTNDTTATTTTITL